MGSHLLALVIVVISLVPALGAEPVALPRTSIRHLASKTNGVAYRLYVSVPRDYESSEARYPVVYTLDADYSFAIAHNIVEHLADRDHLRWAIVVSIAYDGAPAYKRHRTRDYTPSHTPKGGYGPEFQKHSGGGPKFRQFLADELIPFIDDHYRTTDERILVGHSYGGLFSTWTLLTSTLFRGYVIVSPSLWYDDEMIFKVETAVKNAPKARVYLAAGSMENAVMPNTARRMAERLRRHPSIALRSEILAGETHNSIFPSAFSRGLRFVMNGR